ncbi:MAG: D-alanyl-D-alanine carboxypeptidase family protein [Verrucomicrobiia bacterium]|jgi:D-alanyl-D-alanine carboxypeptidase (penicillin-binding protein 5/6)
MNASRHCFRFDSHTFLLFLTFFVAVTAHAAAPAIAETAAVVLRSDTGAWLYTKAADKAMYPASTTKILTTLVAIESGNLDRTATVAASDTKAEPSKVSLRVGQRVPLRPLLYAVMLRSANDASLTVARAVGGSVSDFAALMNARARKAGATQTRFVNPHGLHDPRHVTTARDLALITRAAMANPTFRQITGTKVYAWRYSPAQTLENHNRMLKTYAGCIGGKTGYVKASGKTLVVVAQRGGVELIAVLLNGRGERIWQDAAALLDHGFRVARHKRTSERRAANEFAKR